MSLRYITIILFSLVFLCCSKTNPKDLKNDSLLAETILDFKGDSIGVTSIRNNKSYVQILENMFERPIQCELQGNIKANRIYFTRSYPKTKPYVINNFLQIMDLEGNIILDFDRSVPIMTSLVPSTNISFSPIGDVMFWGIKKNKDEKFVESIKVLDKNGHEIFFKEELTNQKQYHYPTIAINEARAFLVCYTNDLNASPNREWIFKYYAPSRKVIWEYIYKGYFVRDAAINEKGSLFFIADNENFKINKQELYIIEDKGQTTVTKSLDIIYTQIYYKSERIINLRRRLINEEDQNVEIVLN